VWHFVRNRQDACSTKSLFFVVVCSHLEQARCLFHKESVFLWDGPESPSGTGKMPVPQRVSFFVVVCSHLEQAFGLVPQRVSFLVGWASCPSLWEPRNRVFFPKDALQTVTSVKNPVSLSECVQECLNPDKYKELGKLD
jgi:hypothetical protein